MTEQAAPFRNITIDQMKALVDDGYDVVDVRDDWEWNRGHIPGARHVVLNDILKSPHSHKFQDRTIFVCAVGSRSAIASEMAVALGTKDVVNLMGGTDAWRKAGLPLDRPEGTDGRH